MFISQLLWDRNLHPTELAVCHGLIKMLAGLWLSPGFVLGEQLPSLQTGGLRAVSCWLLVGGLSQILTVGQLIAE